jgi:hypothetical protein
VLCSRENKGKMAFLNLFLLVKMTFFAKMDKNHHKEASKAACRLHL